ncbi:nitroreductase [Reichenbachiella sp. MSK19-1]|uniref:nitroreductase family protein n=1 Tax=Reichenbachiella sp. MSK19-1 TaxID=1897631 RepID=UPI000E6BA39B|nr:nitroreductase [Reichenbachiella sp. MSK19-1]RJE71329.1 nitroreductase [Reichenbachiella sp. MSK19-1]
MKFDAAEVSKLLQNRRSIFPKQYSGERVSDEIIAEMLENANWAPTYKKTEPWRFQVFCDEGLKTLGDLQVAAVEKAEGKKVDKDKIKKLRNKPLECSHVIAIGMKRNKSIRKVEEICAVAAAVQNMHLTATAHGVGCYWSTGGVTFLEEAKPFFDLGKKDLLLGFLYIGMPAKDKWPTSKRKPIEKKVDWIRE